MNQKMKNNTMQSLVVNLCNEKILAYPLDHFVFNQVIAQPRSVSTHPARDQMYQKK